MPLDFTKIDKFDIFSPEFENLGNQPIYEYELNSEDLYINTSDGFRNEVFGYKEAWAEYRYEPNRISGQFRHGNGYDENGSLYWWTYSQDLGTDTVSLSPDFITESSSKMGQTLRLNTPQDSQMLIDFHSDIVMVSPVPLHSIPGLTRF